MHILQPADVSVFKSIKCAWKKIVSDWQKEIGSIVVTKANFASLIEVTLQEVIKYILQKGFEKCRIYSF